MQKKSYNPVQLKNGVSQDIFAQIGMDIYVDTNRLERRERLQDTVENLRDRFGKKSITYLCGFIGRLKNTRRWAAPGKDARDDVLVEKM